VRAQGTTLGEPLGALAAAGPRAADDPTAYSEVFEKVLEGYLLHYAEPSAEGPDDPDMRLLSGDLAYALGLARLAELGDLEAVSQLADLISLCAQVHVEGRAGLDEEDSLPAALWALCALAVGTGPWPGGEQVKEAVRAGETAAATALAEARRRARQSAIEHDLNSALIAFRGMVRPASRST
jgi:hypothetical protein